MPASPYGPAYERARAHLIGRPCHMCGAPATEADHVPALAQHRHVEFSGCCELRPACRSCQARQGGQIRAGQLRTPPTPGSANSMLEPVGFDAGDPVWDVPWLDDLRDVPPEATWPRYMTVPHPAATGSYGAAAVDWLERVAGIELRWWQRLMIVRQLEHDDTGVLVWLTMLLTASRQSGKSTGLRATSTWRLHGAGTFGEPQTILHTGKDLPVCKEVQRLASAWAKSRDYPVREQNGNEQITEPDTGSRWIVRGKGSVYGYPGSMVLCDEAWGVAPAIVDDGLEPTMLERQSPQLVLASTAHRRATPLFPVRRVAALDELAAPNLTLILEWSAPRDAPIDDRAAWRMASPHWSTQRERLIEGRLARVRAGESIDPDETDPVESFRAQILNVWPARAGVAAGDLLFDSGVWPALADPGADVDGRVVLAIEDWFGQGAAAAAAGRTGDGRWILGGRAFTRRIEAVEWIRQVAGIYGADRIVAGASLMADADIVDLTQIAPLDAAGAGQTRAGLALARSLAADRMITHDGSHGLDPLGDARVVATTTGLNLAAHQRADLIRAVLWALLAAQTAEQPMVH